MDKKLLEQYNLTDSQKRFKKLYEYSFNTISEAGPEDAPSADPAGGDPGAAPSPESGADPNGGGGEQPATQDGAPMSDLPQDSPVPPDPSTGGDPGAAPDPADPSMGGEEEIGLDDEEEVEEIDVTELSDGQDELKDGIVSINNKFKTFMDFAEKLTSQLSNVISKSEQTEQELTKLGQEIKQRVPTETEKLNLRSLDSTPFNVPPTNYWEKISDQRIYH
jgi:hypothetical protein